MHISDKVKNQLHIDGWAINGDDEYQRLIANFSDAGHMSSGDRMVKLTIDATGRWFSRVDGWGKVVKDVDLREVKDAKEAIEDVLRD